MLASGSLPWIPLLSLGHEFKMLPRSEHSHKSRTQMQCHFNLAKISPNQPCRGCIQLPETDLECSPDEKSTIVSEGGRVAVTCGHLDNTGAKADRCWEETLSFFLGYSSKSPIVVQTEGVDLHITYN